MVKGTNATLTAGKDELKTGQAWPPFQSMKDPVQCSLLQVFGLLLYTENVQCAKFIYIYMKSVVW